MKLEYFDDSSDGPVLLLHSGSPHEVECLRSALRPLIVAGGTLCIDGLDFINAVDGCRINAASVSAGGVVGVIAPSSGTGAFEWNLTPSEWQLVTELLEPFCRADRPGAYGSHQYLHEHGGTEVIYSTGRGW